VVSAQRQPRRQAAPQQAAPQQAPPESQKPPTINWGKCPQLEPKESDKTTKATILEGCLKSNPIPKNLTETSIENHQRTIAECALKRENWFSKSGTYRFSKAETEIKRKGLPKDIETQLVAHHKKCKTESEQKFPQKAKIIDLVQLYQACMDFHITETCGIKLE
jgi:hypothetical protein